MGWVHVSDGGIDLAALCGDPDGDVVASSGDVTCRICLSAPSYCGTTSGMLTASARVPVGAR